MKRKLLSLVLTGTLCLGLAVPALAAGLDNFQRSKTYSAGQFTDVPAGEWYAANVQAAYELGLMEGNTGTTFNPGGNLTIAEALALACRLHSTYVGDNAVFAISGGTWYQPYVDYAAENGILAAGAYTDYTATATRAQFASILAASLPAEALTAINSVTALPDVPADAAYAAAVLSLYNAGVLTGSDAAGSFRPDTTIQRSEVATIVTRMADPSLRKSFTLTPTGNGTAPSPDDGKLTLEDLQGVWYKVSYYESGNLDSEEEIIIEGNQFTRTYHYFFDSYEHFSQIKGIIKEVAENYTTGNPPRTYPYAIVLENATITTNGDGPFVTEEYKLPYSFSELDLSQGRLGSLTKASSPALLPKYLAAVGEKADWESGKADPAVFTFLADYIQTNGEIDTFSDHAGQYRVVLDLYDKYSLNWDFRIYYDPVANEISLYGYNNSSLDDDSKYTFNFYSTFEVILTSDMAQPYPFTYSSRSSVDRWGSLYMLPDEQVYTGYVDPSAFSYYTEKLEFETASSSDELVLRLAKENCAKLLNSLVYSLYDEILQPNGYQFSSIGFDNFFNPDLT